MPLLIERFAKSLDQKRKGVAKEKAVREAEREASRQSAIEYERRWRERFEATGLDDGRERSYENRRLTPTALELISIAIVSCVSMQGVNKAEVVRLYVENGLTQGQIGDALGVTRQYVSLILKRENIPVDRKRHAKPKRISIDRDVLERLYVEERNSVERICKILGVSNTIVARCLKEHGIQRRPHGGWGIVYPQLRRLKIGETREVSRLPSQFKARWIRFYSMAKHAGIRVSLKTIAPGTFRLTRVG